MAHFYYNRKMLLVLALLAITGMVACLSSRSKKVDFSTDVKPILNKKCITCHGGVKAKGGFSVLFREEALAKTESGTPAIIPGDPDNSEMIRRLTLKDPEERMPYKHEPLSEDEIDILRRWVKQGAQWGDHWAYLPVKQTPAPDEDDSWIRNDVDRFIYEKLDAQDLKPAPQADPQTLLRRVSLDLIGMYPSPAIADQYLKNPDDKGYERLVDSLLASPHFGEKWTSLWLDLSRYADTKGYESDGGRSIWRYRDWLIDAFNKDKPYDAFLTEQIAGDLLPGATDAQYIATAFSRNSMTNDEGGTDNEEFRVAAVMDRVNTTWESIMGTTFSCVQCHSHPYDPFHHDEYYKFMAYFNNTRDNDIPGEYPVLREYNDSLKNELAQLIGWIKDNGTAEQSERVRHFLKTLQPAFYATTADSLKNALPTNKNGPLNMRNQSYARLKHIQLDGIGQIVFMFYSNKPGGKIIFRKDHPQGEVLGTYVVQPEGRWRYGIMGTTPATGVHDIYVTYQNPGEKGEDIMATFDWFGFLPELPAKGTPGYDAHEKTYRDLLNAPATTTPVMVENPVWMQRETHVFERGNRLTLGKAVQPAVPQSLAFAMPANAPGNRMGLAMWLTDKRNPLVSRTMVNRLWEQLFGTGIVETLEDMGTQGMLPTHRELLDHLSWKFMNDYKWGIKKLLKEMVMSATYRQDSKLTDELKEKDPANKFYARGPRVRLSAEQLRDQNLCISGLMSGKMYGPGVMPWQPDGIWLSPYNGARWNNSTGEDQYRRAVYTYWKRTAPYPSMISFDGVQRVLCTARRIKTNTPLQALTTLNDSAYIDMARHLAYRMQKEGGSEVTAQIRKGYQLMLYKSIKEDKLKVFEELYTEALKEFKSDSGKTTAMVGGQTEKAVPGTAALVVVANAMLNLDEVVVKN
ncbi:DUF1553 domain-containing protein [Niabella drilacis]|uniref:Carbohydrate binding module (Family 6) n=1 Tax=Niabella drilacis (strain DSM 25811 / CCM 8410 / CCUG 62505 / LMG 26954 / E90) TaxID=1285928 RepID=A0A1G7BAE4_NIADE|nr:DUF1553 domain-containing protein [Niabella drilacis]SDE23306.1 Carbohydrate binding module (family 6) [Niabella drilacis]